ncbi:DUF4145 domain-containing protein [Comamonas sp. PE63]|uniref:DUF4145 domain-containing protein n=1 Tax=Comamonas brasiliensis TaxID=1812482 RepID=UPI0020161271|nr:DUF4145 domain-containing protein [Comamonas sp. PE63]
MAVLVMQCPHCGAENMTFAAISGSNSNRNLTSSIFAQCSACFEGVVAKFALSQAGYRAEQLLGYQGNVLEHPAVVLEKVWPTLPPIDAPQSTPEKVARSFVEAAKSRRSGLWNAACGSYRRCMELALKEFAPDVEAWKLEKRIDKLAAEHRITPALQTWAHELRLDGNEALHGDDDATEDMAEQMHHLTYFLLTYLYTLPNQIEEVRVRREAASE